MSSHTACTFRQRRLARGWQPVQLIGRLRIVADRDGSTLPKTYLLLRLMFEWENQRTPLPDAYGTWLAAIFDADPHRRRAA